ncbi:MAG: hypothetical protein D6767_08230 [Candidatus Hydrogenedentota bacterium]|nr:MAG: hypothetical protein D6767_08230 [Candidatus Hydrogenedentota bacterium]
MKFFGFILSFFLYFALIVQPAKASTIHQVLSRIIVVSINAIPDVRTNLQRQYSVQSSMLQRKQGKRVLARLKENNVSRFHFLIKDFYRDMSNIHWTKIQGNKHALLIEKKPNSEIPCSNGCAKYNNLLLHRIRFAHNFLLVRRDLPRNGKQSTLEQRRMYESDSFISLDPLLLYALRDTMSSGYFNRYKLFLRIHSYEASENVVQIGIYAGARVSSSNRLLQNVLYIATNPCSTNDTCFHVFLSAGCSCMPAPCRDQLENVRDASPSTSCFVRRPNEAIR